MTPNKILLVDDDPEDRAIITDAFNTINAPGILLYAENGAIALEILDNYSNSENSICLIVLDLNMPKINGTQTLKYLKTDPRFKNIPVIIYSTSINPLEKEKCMILGAQDYITKPISYKECIDTANLFFTYCESNTIVETNVNGE